MSNVPQFQNRLKSIDVEKLKNNTKKMKEFENYMEGDLGYKDIRGLCQVSQD